MNVAIIGAGAIARVHARAIQRLAGVNLAAVCDLSPGLARCFAEQFGVAKWYAGHRQLLEEVRPECVFVTTPVVSHAQLAGDGLAAGAHVLVEKPVTANWEQWQTLRKSAEASGKVFVEDQNYRFNGPVRRISGWVESGALGTVEHVDLFCCLPIHGSGSVFADANLPPAILQLRGGAILDLLPHLAYLVQHFLGSHMRVSSWWQKREARTILPHDEFQALVACERGTATMGFSSHSQPPGCYLRVYGSKMTAAANLFEGTCHVSRSTAKMGPLRYFRNGVRESVSAWGGAWRSLARKLAGMPLSYEGLFEFDRRFCEAAAGRGAWPVTLEEVEASYGLVCALTEGAAV